jgi:hypothetical protein
VALVETLRGNRRVAIVADRDWENPLPNGYGEIEVDVWVILRRFIPNALELAAANAHDRDPDFIMKLTHPFNRAPVCGVDRWSRPAERPERCDKPRPVVENPSGGSGRSIACTGSYRRALTLMAERGERQTGGGDERSPLRGVTVVEPNLYSGASPPVGHVVPHSAK